MKVIEHEKLADRQALGMSYAGNCLILEPCVQRYKTLQMLACLRVLALLVWILTVQASGSNPCLNAVLDTV